MDWQALGASGKTTVMKWNSKPFLWAFLVAGLAVVCFLPALQGEFLNWDDRALYVENPYYTGLSSEHWKWMCTTFRYGHWQPLTWLSCALDYKVWKLNASGWHLTNLLLHTVNAMLVYLLCLAFLRRRQPEKKTHPALMGTPPKEGIPEAQVISPMESNHLRWRGGHQDCFLQSPPLEGCPEGGVGYYAASALAALFWAVHPLRVEAVAWLATRGYLLCTTFCLLTVLFYVWRGHPCLRIRAGRDACPTMYLAALLCFALATFTKGIGMMLPLVLLLVDWVFERSASLPLALNDRDGRSTFFLRTVRTGRKPFLRSIPFFLLSLVTGVTAFLAKRADGGMAPVEIYGPVQRIGQAVYGIWFYLLKTASPQNLSPLYEKHPELWQVLVALLFSTAAGIFLFLSRRKLFPIIGAFGAFLLLIFPMLGITQSGSQMFADRFTYLAAVPFSILLATGLARLKTLRRTVRGALAGLLLIFSAETFIYSSIWSDGVVLWTYAISKDRNQTGAHNSLGIELVDRGAYEQALECFNRAISIRPDYADALNNRALIRFHNKDYRNALEDLGRALAQERIISDDYAKMRVSHGLVCEELGNPAVAMTDYSYVIENSSIDPACRLKALQARARLKLAAGRVMEAKDDLSAMLTLPDPSGESHRKAKDALDELSAQ